MDLPAAIRTWNGRFIVPILQRQFVIPLIVSTRLPWHDQVSNPPPTESRSRNHFKATLLATSVGRVVRHASRELIQPNIL